MAVTEPILKEAQSNMKKAEVALQRELGNIRAGRANASLLSRVSADYYGTLTPLNQMASITVPEPRVLMVTPFDKTALKEIEKAILASDLGISPANDGSAIRLVIPQLTEERRKELAKDVKAEGERGKVAVRNARRDAMDALKRGHKAGQFTDDQLHELEDQAQKLTDAAGKAVESIVADKEKEILEG
ncbi:ribosome recycling factor [Lactobacillus sp. CBA3606]|uniref:ribosome recycling factor n=1 Tax=Lactobacillus sp. CBA3606 TaxID=2099789 RepID=UPI000CFDAA33|nr:ribosome recycling factor [Lactobacillus sp. CBA3606]AVK63158.1 ribosome recycling factor [Lactobacillus sp. CBA3606]